MRALARRRQTMRLAFLGQAQSSGLVAMIQSIASAFGVPPSLAVQVADQESSYNPNAVSSKGAQGLFQLMPPTAAQYGVSNSFDPTQNTTGAMAYLSDLYQQFGDWATALTAYNWGPGNVTKYGAAAAPASTKAYVASAIAALPAAPAPTLPAADYADGDVIDVDPISITDSPAAAAGNPVSPNIFLLALLGVAAYVAYDLVRG